MAIFHPNDSSDIREFKMKKQFILSGILLLVVASFGCDPGSITDSERVGDAQCRVTLESNATNFSVGDATRL